MAPWSLNPQYIVECFQGTKVCDKTPYHVCLNPQYIVECFQGAPSGNPLKYWVPEGIFLPACFEHYL